MQSTIKIAANKDYGKKSGEEDATCSQIPTWNIIVELLCILCESCNVYEWEKILIKILPLVQQTFALYYRWGVFRATFSLPPHSKHGTPVLKLRKCTLFRLHLASSAWTLADLIAKHQIMAEKLETALFQAPKIGGGFTSISLLNYADRIPAN